MDRETEEEVTREDNPNAPSIWQRLTHGAPLAVWVAASLYILYKLLPVLKLVAVAMLIAVILRTLLRWLQKLVKPRWIAVLLLVGLIIGFVVFLAAVVFPSLVDETQKLLMALPSYLNALITLSQRLHQSLGFVPDLSQGLTRLRNFADQILNSFPLLLSQTVGIAIELGATLILALYMAYDPKSLIDGFLRLIPRRHHSRVNRLIRATQIRLRGWVFGTGIAMIFLGAGSTIGLLALGIPLSLPFGVIAGLLEVIPYFGSIAGTFLPALVALTISPLKLVLVLVLFFILNQIDAHIVQPLVIGQQVNLHPVVIILTFLVMGKLLGFVGILLAVPTAAVVTTFLNEFNPEEPAKQVIQPER